MYYDGNCYGSISQRDPSASVSGDGEWYAIPDGWQIATYSADLHASVGTQYYFGTWRLVYSDAKAYGAGDGGVCGRCNCGFCGGMYNCLVTRDNNGITEYKSDALGGNYMR